MIWCWCVYVATEWRGYTWSFAISNLFEEKENKRTAVDILSILKRYIVTGISVSQTRFLWL